MVVYAAMDISSDLTELGRTPVAVISAGVKSILDIPRTIEYLVTGFSLEAALQVISQKHHVILILPFETTGNSGSVCCSLWD